MAKVNSINLDELLPQEELGDSLELEDYYRMKSLFLVDTDLPQEVREKIMREDEMRRRF
jgi:hypothetical protein